jgi:ABC-type glycerol-3-phosphate transport system substrate-binding protein
MTMGIKQKTWLVMCLVFVIFLGFFSFFSFENEGARARFAYSPVRPDLSVQQQSMEPLSDVIAEISPSSFENASELGLIPTVQSENYDVPVVHLYDDRTARMEVAVPSSGYYHISFHYLTLGNEMVDPHLSIMVNGEYQNASAERISAPLFWRDVSHDFEHNRHGHELISPQVQINAWFHGYARCSIDWSSVPLLFHLEAGVNEITITNRLSELYLGRVYITTPASVPTYDEYHATRDVIPSNSGLMIVEAEHPVRKSSSFIRQVAVSMPDVSPYDSRYLLLNTFGGDSWHANGQSVTWQIEIPETGHYQLTFHAFHELSGASVFRTIEINGEIPFEALRHYAFDFSRRFDHHTLSDASGHPVYIFFEAGIHEITLIADSAPIMPVVENLAHVREEIHDLALDIRQLTGGQVDPNRDWVIDEFIPNIDEMFASWMDLLEESRLHLQEVYADSSESNAELELQLMINGLSRLAENPNELPTRMSELSEGASSVAQMIGELEQSLQSQPLLLNSIYIHSSADELPAPTATLARRLYSGISQFWASFNVIDNSPDSDEVLDIWVRRSQWYVELLQNMTDSMFTPETGIHVRFSVMPNDQKLILANAADEQPDLALGVANWIPYQMALRGAAADLTQFEGYEAVIADFSPGAFLPLMIDGGLYGMPETQDFYVLFYRSDIMNQLGIPVPDTWEEVTEILPELQRQGLNFFAPLSGPAATKPFMFTAPFFYQFGGDVHGPDALETAINTEESLEAMRFMTDLYMMYSLPLQVANFYNDFRYGSLPIGISNFETYIQLTVAAPEIAGAWNIALHPGVDDGSGNISRWASGSAASAMILEDSDNQAAAWEFLKWWLQTETQVAYSNNLRTLFGPEFIWNTANLEAFAQVSIPEAHREVILAQWEYLREVPLTPASYMIEREISNIWNASVFEGENLRVSTDSSVIRINREIRRRMEEFGYIDSYANVLHPYILPTIELVEELSHDE